VAGGFEAWFEALERRHLASLTFREVRHGLQALSSLYVERRQRLGRGAALEGEGKRAAFALFYGPLHFLTVREIVAALGSHPVRPALIVDLGAGTGAAGAAWALSQAPSAELLAVERHGWAAGEATWTLGALGLRGRVQRSDVGSFALPGHAGGILAAYTANELDETARGKLLERLLVAAGAGAAILVVEPLARRAVPWWEGWRAAFAAAGGRADEWRFRVPLPERLALLDKAAGLDHRELGARSLWIPPARAREGA
jgi:hypothetical protein